MIRVEIFGLDYADQIRITTPVIASVVMSQIHVRFVATNSSGPMEHRKLMISGDKILTREVERDVLEFLNQTIVSEQLQHVTCL